MKKFLILLLALCFPLSYGGNIKIYNNTTYSLGYNITAINSVANPYPMAQTSGTSTYMILTPFGTETYSTPTGFPFDSGFDMWQRMVTSLSPWIQTTPALAQTLFGSTLIFGKFKFNFENTSFSGNVGEVGFADFMYIYDVYWGLSVEYFEIGDTYYIIAD
jgi:hypothetical protein